MTDLTKAVSRVVDVNGKQYVATFAQAGVSLREKGKRKEYGPVAWSLILLKGEQAAALAIVEERTTKRRAKRVSRGLLSVVR